MKLKDKLIKVFNSPKFWYYVILYAWINIAYYLLGVISGMILFLFLVKIIFGS
jgi:hypothetical protein